jgi:Mg2+ and Co2+ transporter CorA
MRIDLEMNLDVLEYEKERVERLPGVTNTFQANSLEKIDNLIDAIEAIIQAIESGVYESEEELHEAKKNLLIKYRMPKWHALIHVRADRMISWIAQILGYIEEILTEEELSELLQSSLEKTALCFEEGEILLESVLNDETYSESKEKFRQAQMHIKSCTALAREANTLRVQENEEDPNSVAEPPLSRRLLRRGLKLLP